ncbi:MAG TPA: class I SAM-dependent methyltransferase [Solirubrobacteraceae bacterium]|nr:class I SAM-dependent methyltransferase [Solirubrobacteraceae bacterium]
MAQSQIYARARGPLGPVAEPFAARARRRRLEQFMRVTGVGPETRILDVGCGGFGLRALLPDFDITGVDLVARPEYPGPFVRADATEHLPFDDQEFEIGYANSVIEHLAPERRPAFARELRRVSRGWYVQTPAMSFPIEPHALLPAAHWLPRALRRRYWRLGAGGDPDEVQLLRRRELELLFGPAIPERFGPLTKSWVCVRSP